MILPRKRERERKKKNWYKKAQNVERTCLTCFLIIISYIIIFLQNITEPTHTHTHTIYQWEMDECRFFLSISSHKYSKVIFSPYITHGLS